MRPAPADPPGKYETGTQNHEGIAGTLAAVNYLAAIGARYGTEDERCFPQLTGRRLHLKTAMAVLRAYDHVLSEAILANAAPEQVVGQLLRQGAGGTGEAGRGLSNPLLRAGKKFRNLLRGLFYTP